MPTIEGIDINGTTIGNCYKKYYPDTYKQIIDFNLFNFLHLWGVRVSTCDSSLPDDLVGGLRVNNFNILEAVTSKASTEPSPKYVATPMSDARLKGGAAFVAEGQYPYYYNGKNHPTFKPLPSFCPLKPVKVYRWTPSDTDIAQWKKNKKPLTQSFEEALKSGKVSVSTSPDVCIHRTWAKEKLLNDSAGCQVLTDDASLIKLGDWAVAHQKKKYGNQFIYTLFTKEQFIEANKGFDVFSLLKSFGK